MRNETAKLKEDFKQKEDNYLVEVEKLTRWVKELSQNLDETQGQNKKLN